MDEVSDRRGWHINKGVDLIHIVTTGVLLIGGLWFLAEQNTRISNLELSYRHMQQLNMAEQDRTEKKFDDLKTDLRLINSKLDRLIESESSGR
ncbi:hypothetical protein [Marinobacter algicola]|uniref:Uncharacterized protein n=1 Tax=Marinobacter algicola DG893 TaxID=443152 RepID=A6F0L0_9GAMM|nr:hypothetical protein [Marinobacter algicola]EDM47771.1 hypothetical protein MDG893_20664 [Marinobacter algicola DG893]